MHGLVTVPILASYLSHILEKTKLRVLVTVESHLREVLIHVSDIPTLKHIVVVGNISEADKDKAVKAGIELIAFNELEQRGADESYDDVQVGKATVLLINQMDTEGFH